MNPNGGDNRYVDEKRLRRPDSDSGQGHYQQQGQKELRRPMVVDEGLSSDMGNNHYCAPLIPESQPIFGYPHHMVAPAMYAPTIISQPVPAYTLSPNAAEFIPRGKPLNYRIPYETVEQMMPAPEPVSEPVPDMDSHPAVADLRQALFTLTINPGKFHSRVPILSKNLNSTIHEDSIFEHVVDVIFDQSVVEPNFRYTGARLCDYLQKHLTLKMTGGEFRSYLLKRCQGEYEAQVNKTIRNKEEKARLQGFVMFMAELFTNMEIENSGVKVKVDKIGDVLPELVMKLAYDSCDDSNFKCLCQVIKLSGASLEEYEKEKYGGKTKKMDNLFALINKHVGSKNLKNITNEMLSKVIELRRTEWGALVPSPSAGDVPNASHMAADGTIFYGPDGLPLSNEETQFLQKEIQPLEDQSNNDFSDSYGSEAEDYNCGMDDEMYDAYEEFLAQSSQH